MFSIFLTGIMIGFLVAAPVGPIDLLCMRMTLKWGMRAGLITGLGAAFADALYGAFAAFGIAALIALLIDYKLLFQAIGGIFLCYIGVKAFLVTQFEESDRSTTKGLFYAFSTTFFLALMSPMTILSFIGAFAVLGVEGMEGNGFDAALILTLGVFFGSALWWLILSSGVSFLRKRIDFQRLYWIDRFTGIFMLGFGLFAVGYSVVLGCQRCLL